MSTFADRFEQIQERIADAARRHGREPGEITLLAVSKTQPAERLLEALACGQHAFGENYVRELTGKADALQGKGVEWHFIGPLQSNKTRPIAEICQWVHSVDREKVARRLSEQRPAHLPPLQVCLQVNISGEASKSGATPENLARLAEVVAGLPGLTLRGLMAIPAATADTERQRRSFASVRLRLEDLQGRGFPMDTLSMGMSNDLEAAIAEGATLVRIGTALFGQRVALNGEN